MCMSDWSSDVCSSFLVTRVEESFDMIHVVPPEVAPDFVRSSPLAAASGFIEVDEATLQHVRYANVFALGDTCSASNAKTMAAARKQAPVVAGSDRKSAV